MEYKRLLVDTSVFIDFLRQKDKTQTALFRIPDEVALAVSAVTRFELFAGATNEGKWQDVKLLTDDLQVLPFTDEVAKIAARIALDLRKKNKMIEFRDIFIASTAIANRLPVKTFNEKHFNRIEGLVMV